MINPVKPRPDVIKYLAEQALAAMDGTGIENITVAEVISASFTLMKNITNVVMEQCEPEDLEHNRSTLINAIGEVYAIVQPPKGLVN